jgi:hypothetical protein
MNDTAIRLPEDGGVLPADHLSQILAGDAWPECTGYSRTVAFVDFDWHGKPFTQVVILLRPACPAPGWIASRCGR